jgi:hypothetical protein
VALGECSAGPLGLATSTGTLVGLTRCELGSHRCHASALFRRRPRGSLTATLPGFFNRSRVTSTLSMISDRRRCAIQRIAHSLLAPSVVNFAQVGTTGLATERRALRRAFPGRVRGVSLFGASG